MNELTNHLGEETEYLFHSLCQENFPWIIMDSKDLNAKTCEYFYIFEDNKGIKAFLFIKVIFPYKILKYYFGTDT